MREKVEVLISSVFAEDFKSEREALKQEIDAHVELKNISLDYGKAQTNGTHEESLSRVAQADIVVFLIGYSRYGTIRQDGKSMTHLEYEEAKRLGKKMLAYIFPLTQDSPDRAHIERFIEQIEKEDATTAMYVAEEFVECKSYFVDKASLEKKNETEKQRVCPRIFSQGVLNDILRILPSIQTQLPFGVVKLRDSGGDSLPRYKKSLFGNTLPYFSRSEFKKDNPDISPSFKTEEEIYKEIASLGEYRGVLIKGEGGIGKTRLMLEIGRLAKKDGWEVLEISRAFENWSELKLQEEKRYCFLFDYVEQNRLFGYDLFEQLEMRFGKNKIIVVGNTRNTYREDTPLMVKEFFIDVSKKEEKRYLGYVVEKILALETQSRNIDTKALKEAVATKPSFAVFLTEKAKLDEINFHNISHIDTYLQNRLKTTLHKKNFSEIPPEVFALLCNLPLEERFAPDDEFVDELIEDGWILDGTTLTKAFHDTIMDELFVSYLKHQSGRKLRRVMRQILDFSVECGTFKNALRSFGNISQMIEIAQPLSQLLRSDYLGQIRESVEFFIRSSLLGEVETLRFLLENSIVEKDSEASIKLLSKAMKASALDESQKTFLKELFFEIASGEAFAKKLQDNYFVTFFIPAYYIFFPTKEAQEEVKRQSGFDMERFALGWIKQYGGLHDADYVMREYLLKGENPQAIAENVRGWLERNKDRVQQSYLISAYLESPATSLDDIDHYVVHFIKNFPNSESFSFTVDTYLHQGGALYRIEKTVLQWLEEHRNSQGYPFVVQAYLEAGGDVKKVENGIVEWIQNNTLNTLHAYVVQKYLKYGGNIEKIRNVLLSWLKNNAKSELFSYLIQSYLEGGGELREVEAETLEWLEEHKNDDEFVFVAQAYLKASKTPQKIKHLVTQWLNANTADEKYAYLVQAYIKSGGRLDEVRQGLVRWLQSNYTHEIYPFVVQHYLDGGGDLKAVEEGIVKWLKNNTRHISYTYVVQSYGKRVASLKKVRDSILQWLDTFYNEERYKFMVLFYFQHHENIAQTTSLREIFHYVLHIMLNHKRQYSKYLLPLKKRITSLVIDYKLFEDENSDTAYLFICNKALKTDMFDETLKTKILEEFGAFYKNVNYYLYPGYIKYFQFYNEYCEYVEEGLIEESECTQKVRRYYEEAIEAGMDDIVMILGYLKRYDDIEEKTLQAIRKNLLSKKELTVDRWLLQAVYNLHSLGVKIPKNIQESFLRNEKLRFDKQFMQIYLSDRRIPQPQKEKLLFMFLSSLERNGFSKTNIKTKLRPILRLWKNRCGVSKKLDDRLSALLPAIQKVNPDITTTQELFSSDG